MARVLPPFTPKILPVASLLELEETKWSAAVWRLLLGGRDGQLQAMRRSDNRGKAAGEHALVALWEGALEVTAR